MPARAIIKGVLHNFLGTYTSRYTNYKGYWLFGFIAAEPGDLEFDLLDDCKATDTVSSIAAAIASDRFRDQLKKAGLNPTIVRTAKLTIKKRPGMVDGQIIGHSRKGYVLEFQARVTSDLGREFQSETRVFTAPHNPDFETQSAW